ncbi:hypothetical protein PPERSA_01387 [Pseudocohnilembus persalinus]|uniref:PABC domain-containing protein n=1 Tax=Pseudocohnilembus persalinus TaxID=266149 RepID=A0A0V0QH38_PSEPJ|nr:hypothetical protein PPERSA_01387 [Pseudocohnilembus persalinus]|eukprot:KRX01484.1 hypothetical protein PPERSA_01387 [Pseudocohnilembus persalinus]
MFLIKSEFKPHQQLAQQQQYNSLQKIKQNIESFRQLKEQQQCNYLGNILLQKVCKILSMDVKDKIVLKITGMIIDQSRNQKNYVVQLIENENQLKILVFMLKEYIDNLKRDLINLIENGNYSGKLKNQLREWIHKMEYLDDQNNNKVAHLKEQEKHLLKEVQKEKKNKGSLSEQHNKSKIKKSFLNEMDFFSNNMDNINDLMSRKTATFQKLFQDDNIRIGGKKQHPKPEKKQANQINNNSNNNESKNFQPFENLDEEKKRGQKSDFIFGRPSNFPGSELMDEKYMQEMFDFIDTDSKMIGNKNNNNNYNRKKNNRNLKEENGGLLGEQIENIDINFLREQGEIFNQMDEEIKFVILEKLLNEKIKKLIQELNIDLQYQMVIDYIQTTGEFFAEDIVNFYDNEDELIQIIEDVACNINEDLGGEFFG